MIYGDGLGACAAAIAAQKMGLRTVMVRRYEWLGGQLTSQMVPLDEHPWIERFGCTASYRELRNRVRNHYRALPDLLPEHREDPFLNPGRCWVSRIGHEPEVAASILASMVGTSSITFVSQHRPEAKARMAGSRIQSIVIDDRVELQAAYYIDASETGDLLPATGTDYRIGAESRAVTGEMHARERANPLAQQAITWCFSITHDGEAEGLETPEAGEHIPSWPGYPDLPLFGWSFPNPVTGEIKTLPPLESDFSLFAYRRILCGDLFDPPRQSVSVVNWPQNDYFIEPMLDNPKLTELEVANRAKRLSHNWLAWMQTEGAMPGFRLHAWAQGPYIRESRRIVGCKTVTEETVAAEVNPGADRAPSFEDSIGVGAYRIDLHPRTDGDGPLDLSSLPFEIPLGALIPKETRNLIAGAKNIGTTHITNGCYRLHPVEWNVGEATALVAAYCLEQGVEPIDAWSSPIHVIGIQDLCDRLGIERRWPDEELGPL